jgi:gas vesicle protein
MKRSELAEYIKETIVDVLTEVSQEDVDTAKAYNDELEKTKKLQADLTEDEDAEPTAKDIKKNDSISTISRKLQDTSKEMKAVVNKWKKAEGEDKERLLARLKELTKIKKELEGLL